MCIESSPPTHADLLSAVVYCRGMSSGRSNHLVCPTYSGLAVGNRDSGCCLDYSAANGCDFPARNGEKRTSVGRTCCRLSRC